MLSSSTSNVFLQTFLKLLSTQTVMVKYLMSFWLFLWPYTNRCDMLVFLGAQSEQAADVPSSA